MFIFLHDLGVQRVLDDGPWTLNQQVMLIKKLEVDDQIANVKFYECYIWLKLYDMRIYFNSEFILKPI